MSDIRLPVDLPEEWLRAVQRAAKAANVSAGEYIRRMIEVDPGVHVACAGVAMPPIRKVWGGWKKPTGRKVGDDDVSY